MPITLRALAQDRQTLRIDYGDAGDLNIVYTPSLLTEKLLTRLSSMTGETAMGDAAEIVNAVLLKLVLEWDLLDDDGEPLPLTVDGMGEAPLKVRFDIMQRIASDMRLGEPKGTPSPTRSRKHS